MKNDVIVQQKGNSIQFKPENILDGFNYSHW